MEAHKWFRTAAPQELSRDSVASFQSRGLIQIYRHPRYSGVYCLTATKKSEFEVNLPEPFRWLDGMLVVDSPGKQSGTVTGLPRPRLPEWWQSDYFSNSEVYFKAFQELVHGRPVYVRFVPEYEGGVWLTWSPPGFRHPDIEIVQDVVDYTFLTHQETHQFVVTDPQGIFPYNKHRKLVCYTGSVDEQGHLLTHQLQATEGRAHQLVHIPVQQETSHTQLTRLLSQPGVIGYRGWVQPGVAYEAYVHDYIQQLAAYCRMDEARIQATVAHGTNPWDLWDDVPRPVAVRNIRILTERQKSSDASQLEALVSGADTSQR